MHVTYGLSPRFVDDDVRFRTTYYFRTFDYCWDANATVKQQGVDVKYRNIIPQTDTLYRYRMTGKASALFNRTRFESGVLKASAIDPFGTQVSYSREADGFLVRSNTEVKEAADRAERNKAQRTADLTRLQDMMAAYQKLDPAQTDLRTKALEKITEAMDRYLASTGASVSSEDLAALKKSSDELKDSLIDVKKQLVGIAAANVVAQQKLDEILAKAQIAVTVVQSVATGNLVGDCSISENVKKGFQIMGPEGLKTFDQSDRLVMAMSSSAKPLIETLQEYSGRILSSRVDTSAQLLAIAQENLRTEAARRALADARTTKPDADKVLDMAIAAFGGEQK